MDQNVVDKILKCLSMADSAEYNEFEAANALRAAKRLAEQYGLDFAEIEAQKQHTTSDKVKYETTTHKEKPHQLQSWHKVLLHALEPLFGVRHYYYSTGITWRAGFVLFGVAQDVAIAKEAFAILKRTGARFATAMFGSTYSRKRNSYLLGFAYGIEKQARALVKEAGSTGTSLVVVNKQSQVNAQFNEMTSAFVKSKVRDPQVDEEAFAVGFDKGQETDLDFSNAISNPAIVNGICCKCNKATQGRYYCTACDT